MDDLTPCLHSLLEGITYIIVQLKEIMKESFSGASAFAFESTIRINITNAKEAKEWLQQMQQHSKCTYRHSRGRKPGLKRVLYKVETLPTPKKTIYSKASSECCILQIEEFQESFDA